MPQWDDAGRSGRPGRLPAHAAIASGRHYVRMTGIVVTLTGTAAIALNATFGTSLFKPGLELGTASTVLRF